MYRHHLAHSQYQKKQFWTKLLGFLTDLVAQNGPGWHILDQGSGTKWTRLFDIELHTFNKQKHLLRLFGMYSTL